jgi:hypothetical protein
MVLVDTVGWSRPRVAALLDKDNSAIWYAYQKAQWLYRRDPDFFDAVETLNKEIAP